MSNAVEIPFSTTLLVRDTCLCLHVQRAARALARLFDDALRPVGLTNGQFSLMMSLNRPEPPPMGPVATLLAMDQTTLTAALKPLQRRGWVNVTQNAKDKRRRLLSLTPEGQNWILGGGFRQRPAHGARLTMSQAARASGERLQVAPQPSHVTVRKGFLEAGVGAFPDRHCGREHGLSLRRQA